MRFLPPTLRLRLSDAGLLPTSKLARTACALAWQTLLLWILQQGAIAGGFKWAQQLTGTIEFIAFIVFVLFLILGLRRLKDRMLWRLRNRLIVTYVFIGVIPVILLSALALGSFYLVGGQFATFIVTTSLDSELHSMEAANTALAHEMAVRLDQGATPEALGFQSLQKSNKAWANRHVHVWKSGKLVYRSTPEAAESLPPILPAYLKSPFREVVRDRGELFLRASETIPLTNGSLTVICSEPLDRKLLQDLAENLGEVTLYTGVSITKVDASPTPPLGTTSPVDDPKTKKDGNEVRRVSKNPSFVLNTSQAIPSFVVGRVPAPARAIDPEVSFGTSVSAMDWSTGDTLNPVVITVQTRVSTLYDRLFQSLGDIAPAIEFSLAVVAVFLAIIEIVALYIGTRLTQTVTGTVAQLYDATSFVNKGDFSRRISVKSNDQLASLATSFNSMTTSLEELIAEQKEKQRLQGELAIAQEVQEQLYPQHIKQMASLEVFGFCRPARSVSGDYYDFLPIESDKLLIAVGDISGKGISAALLMATIHSAVRAYNLRPALVAEELAASGVGRHGPSDRPDEANDLTTSPGTMLALLNHQLYESTPAEKYATLFLATYDERDRSLRYSNGGHLSPLILHNRGTVQRLDQGGTVVGLFDGCSYPEGNTFLHSGDIFLAYSDGVTEPENEYGEFGEARMVELVQANRDLPLARISEIVTAAVTDWIGEAEQPDDITIVLARGR
jgi:sigma-B regulation protein RsbU (phosphoserine phosphatase)